MSANTIRSLDSKLVDAMSALDDANHILIPTLENSFFESIEETTLRYKMLEELRKATDVINKVMEMYADTAAEQYQQQLALVS